MSSSKDWEYLAMLYCMSQYCPSWCKSAALPHCLVCGRYKHTIGDKLPLALNHASPKPHCSWNWWDICHQLTDSDVPSAKDHERRRWVGGYGKERLLCPLFPPRQWPVNLLDVISCSCSALKACKLRNCSCCAAIVSCTDHYKCEGVKSRLAPDT